MARKKRVLFVDDEPRILDGVKRMMRSLHEDWDMDFATSGPQALELLAVEHFDAIVSDMRMPGMSGAELLTIVQETYPSTVRFALSGNAEKDAIIRSIGPIHQYLAKPCEAETLKTALTRSTGLRDLLRSEILKSAVTQTCSLPSLPRIYTELVKELAKPDASLKAVERIISRDLGMSTKILQLVNSAFFGVRKNVSCPEEAVRILGLDTIESLVPSVQVFSQFEANSFEMLSLLQIWEHSNSVAKCSKAIAIAEQAETVFVDSSFIAGLLHDIGKLIIASRFPSEYREIGLLVGSGEKKDWEAESASLGASHAEVGAYLLGLWGFQDSVVEAAAFHHHPMTCFVSGFIPLTTVHAANAIVKDIARPDCSGPDGGVNTEYLREIGLAEKLPKWRSICEDTIGRRKDSPNA